MKAIVIDGFGGIDELCKRGLPCPEPAQADVRIRVVAAGVSALDAAARRGEIEAAPFSPPWIPGFEVAGTVDAMGPACRSFRIGDRVMALLPHGGGYAEFAIVRETLVAPLPPSLLFEEAAAIPLDGSAVWSALFAGPDPLDDTGVAIVLGAEGGAGHIAVQLALSVGARVLADAAPENREFVEKFGSVEWLEPGSTTGDLPAPSGVRPRVVDCRGTTPQLALLTSDLPHEAISSITKTVVQRRLRPRLFKILNIAQAREAHKTLESGPVCGKLALTL